MKIGILYICTGKYDIYFESFYESSEKHFLGNHEKKYFVFTDSITLMETYKNNSKIQFIYQRRLGFPLDTLMRFWMFQGAKDILSAMDFLVFFNANFEFQESIGDEFLPNGNNEQLIAWLHAYFYNKPSFLFSYDRNPKSTAYIPYWKSGKYFQGSLNWGFRDAYFQLIDTCVQNINTDFKRNYIARWHDESHLNKYLLWRNDVKSLDPSYNYPEWSNLPFFPKILLKDKTKGYGYNYLRETS